MFYSECDPGPFLRVVGSRSTRQCRDAAARAQHDPLILDNPLVQRKLKAPLTRDNAQVTGGFIYSAQWRAPPGSSDSIRE